MSSAPVQAKRRHATMDPVAAAAAAGSGMNEKKARGLSASASVTASASPSSAVASTMPLWPSSAPCYTLVEERTAAEAKARAEAEAEAKARAQAAAEARVQAEAEQSERRKSMCKSLTTMASGVWSSVWNSMLAKRINSSYQHHYVPLTPLPRPPPRPRARLTLTLSVPPLSAFPTPFQDDQFHLETTSVRPPITVREVDMISVMTSIMEKPDWMRKLRDPDIKAKWRKEMLEQRKPLNRGGMTKRTVDYLFEELEDVATKAEAEAKEARVDTNDSTSLPSIFPSPIRGLFFSDGLISSDLRARLERGVSKLEQVPESERDWHPGSDMQVLDLVHPSLYCFRIGRSRQTKEPFRVEEALNMFGQGEIKNPKPEEEEDEKAPESSSSSAAPAHYEQRYNVDDYSKSDRYAWLPADLEVSDDGKAARWASYINNLHPTDHHELYDTLAVIVAKFIPMWERVLTELRNPTPHRVDDRNYYYWYRKPEWWNKEIDEEDEQKDNGQANSQTSTAAAMDTDETKNSEENVAGEEPQEEVEMEEIDYDHDDYENRPLYYPDVQLPYAAPSIPPSKYISLAGRRLQVIVKLANIVLTPDKPKYAGGSWHVEGMVNENIVASGIYYYHSSNIKESRLAFRQVCTEPDYEQGDDRGVGAVYGLENEGALNQRLGSIRTSEHRAIAFPNTLQHQVQPFELEDVTKAGYRKILVFFLVDPSSTEVISTANVPPQQRHWLLQATSTPFYQTLLNSTPLIPPLVQLVMDYLYADLGTISQEQAESDRLKLMEERKYFVSQNNERLFEREFSLCEH